MTFDMRDAREIAEKCNSKDESIDHDYWNARAGMFLPTALDEIDRQDKRIAGLEATVNVEINDHNLCVIRSILHGDPHSKEQRIRSFNVAGNVFRRMQKQHAALKKLGKAKRERGKVLVEERKLRMQLDASRFGMGIPEEIAIARSREQLHQEGKL